MATSTLIGLDVGQMQDYTALDLVELIKDEIRHPNEVAQDDHRPLAELLANPAPARYIVRHLQRFELHTSYPDIVARVCAMLERPELLGQKTTLLVDATGVGRGILDMFKAAKVWPKAITIHGGQGTTQQGPEWHVPKRSLVFTLTSLAQARPVRLALGERLPFAAEVRQEMLSFTAKINTETARESFSVWREQAHDDLLLALSMACWWGETYGTVRARAIPLLW